jgi:hypothetical protein
MEQLRGTIVVAGMLVLAVACGDGRDQQLAKAMEEVKAKEAKEEAAKEQELAAKAMEREMQRQAEEKKATEEYEAAKGVLEPFAKLPKKRPKGFALACSQMLEQHDAFMKKTLAGEELDNWNGAERERQLEALRRACHERPVEVAVCQTEVLKQAPEDAKVEHILRLCQEKFAG